MESTCQSTSSIVPVVVLAFLWQDVQCCVSPIESTLETRGLHMPMRFQTEMKADPAVAVKRRQSVLIKARDSDNTLMHFSHTQRSCMLAISLPVHPTGTPEGRAGQASSRSGRHVLGTSGPTGGCWDQDAKTQEGVWTRRGGSDAGRGSPDPRPCSRICYEICPPAPGALV